MAADLAWIRLKKAELVVGLYDLHSYISYKICSEPLKNALSSAKVSLHWYVFQFHHQESSERKDAFSLINNFQAQVRPVDFELGGSFNQSNARI